MFNVSLEIPLPTLFVGRFVQRHNTRSAGIEVLSEPLDCTALASGIAPLEKQHKFLASLLHPMLHFQKLDLKCVLFCLICFAVQFLCIGVFALLEAGNM